MLVGIDGINGNARRLTVLRQDWHKLARDKIVADLPGRKEADAATAADRLMDDFAAIGLEFA